MTVLGLVPSILLMTTCFVRFSVVLMLLRQAIGSQQAPPNQVLTALSLFLTFLVMAPVWQRCYDEGIRPYSQPAAGEAALDDVTRVAASGGNLMPPIITACEALATVGEISNALRAVFGEYRESVLD
ncbi:MAG: methylmalonyl-CoA mutase family protein [Acidobacteria bacterium]|nr:methylmalonyl-CoA mutase family protein [Acidobacteriota bacterium]